MLPNLNLNWKIAAIIAEGHDIGGSSPVVYVSGEEVSVSCARYLFIKLCFLHILVYLPSNFCLSSYFMSLFVSYALFESLKLVGRKKNGRNLKFSCLVCHENYTGK